MKPRTYFLLYDKEGKMKGSLAPMSDMVEMIANLKRNPIVAVREVTFEEWLPVTWAESDYTVPPPASLTENEYWDGGYA